jgi:hypothetical protein
MVALCASVSACSATNGGATFGDDDPGSSSTGTESTTGAGGTGGSLAVGSGAGGSPGAGGGCTQNVDIVFAMDVSTSMGGFLSKLAQEMPAVDAAVKALDPKNPPQYGLVVFVDDAQFVNGGMPYQDVATLQQDFQYWSTFTSSNTQVSGGGYNNEFPENSLDALYDAATAFAWRPAEETLRVVIHTTDDTFWDGPGVHDGVSIAHNYGQTLQALQQAQVRVFSFAAHLGGPDEVDDVSAGWFNPYGPNPAIPAATGGGVFDINDVLSGNISLSASINQSVEGTFCEPYPPPK